MLSPSVTDRSSASGRPSLTQFAFFAIFAGFVVSSVELTLVLIDRQPLGLDFMPLWTAMQLDPSRVYDFTYVTLQQNWRLENGIRPFINPPTTLLLLKGFGWLPFPIAYPAFVFATAVLFAMGAARLGADWRLVMIPVPVVLVALAGQVTFLIGGLAMIALTIRGRPYLSGILFGIAGVIKPQMLILLPIALLAERNWRTMIATGLAALLLGALTLPSGAGWDDWLAALPRFQAYVAGNDSLVAMSASPYAHFGSASWLLTFPLAIAAVWLAFRRHDASLRILALLGGALLIAPYALSYELALLIPPMLAFEQKPRWSLVFWVVLLLNLSAPIVLCVATALLWKRLIDAGALGDLTDGIRTLARRSSGRFVQP